MYNIKLYSNNKDNEDAVRDILSTPDFKLDICSYSEISNEKDGNSKLIIIDFYKADIIKDSFYKDFINKIAELEKPVLIILGLNQSELIPVIAKLGLIADDIIYTKQVKKELKARVNFILSRIHQLENKKNLIYIGGLKLDLEKYELTIEEIPVELTFKEYELLKLLIENKNKVFSRNKLLSMIWGYDFYGGSRTVDVHIRRLRIKIGAPYNEMIKTVRNVGYMFTGVN